MSWHYSRALVEEYLALNSWDLELYVLSKKTPSADLFLYVGKTKDTSSLSQFGMTSVHLTEVRGEIVLDYCRAGSHVRISPLQAVEQESPELSQGSGWRWPGSSLKYYPSESLWRTRHASLFQGWGLDEFSETWPRSGMMLHGESWELGRLEPLTREIESGFWQNERMPSPCASDWKGSHKPGQRRRQLTDPAMGVIPAGGALSPIWTGWLMGFPIGWTDSEPMGTPRFLSWLLMHSASLNSGYSEGESDDD